MEDPGKNENHLYRRSAFSIRRLIDMVPARLVLYLLSFSGFLVSFMMRMDINLAMVEMTKVQHLNETDSNNTQPYCYNPSANVSNSELTRKGTGEFDWSTTVQNSIIGSFYWGYILSQVVGGVLTQYFGTKTIFGGSQLLTAIGSLVIPTVADIHYTAMIALRFTQGVASGLTWPAMYAIVGHWIPPAERSRFMSSFQGFSFGIGITYPICGFIIAHYGWRAVFYTTGSIGISWCIVWYFFAFDTPALHPRITQHELRYIQGSVANEITEGMRTPWKSILLSMPAWSIGITTFGRIWVHYVFIISGPVYMKTVLGFTIKTNGILSGVPFICSYLSSVVFCYIADVLVSRQLMSLTNVRKLFTAMSQVIPGILVVVIGYLGCNFVAALVFWFIAVSLITAAYAGAMVSIVDIAPNFAGPVLAFAQTIHMTASFLSPLATGFITEDGPTPEAWMRVFVLTCCIACGTYIVFQIFGTADIQPWNYPDQKVPQPANDDAEPLNDNFSILELELKISHYMSVSPILCIRNFSIRTTFDE